MIDGLDEIQRMGIVTEPRRGIKAPQMNLTATIERDP